jgi:hypothetical protein
MDLANLVPSYQPLPFPLPVWSMQALLVLGFYLHALPMNVILGGGFLTAILFFVGKNDKNSYAYRAARAFAISLPLFISFAITQGIVPLLFLQLLYGPAFYTSSIVMAVPWLSLLAILLVSYYISYIVIYRILYGEYTAGRAAKASLWLMVMSIGFAVIAYLFTCNMTLMLAPQKWLSLYQANPRGTHIDTTDAQLIPRYVHSLLASFAVAGMTLGCFGLYLKTKEPPFSAWMLRLGSRVFLFATLLQLPVGIWYLSALPPQFSACFLGSDPLITGVFVISMVLMLVSIVASALTAGGGKPKAFVVALAANALLILTMIINRHQLRLLYLTNQVKPDTVPVSPQWDLLAIFLVSAVALIAYLVWLCRTVWRGYHPTPAANAADSVTQA